MFSQIQEKFLRFPNKLGLAALLDQFVGLGLGQFGVVAGLHGVVATALSLGTQVGSIAEHLSQRHVGIHLNSTGTGDLAQDVTTTSSNVTDNGTHIFIGHSDANLHDGLQNHGVSLPAGTPAGGVNKAFSTRKCENFTCVSAASVV